MTLADNWLSPLLNVLESDNVAIAAPTISNLEGTASGCGVRFQRPAVPPFGIEWHRQLRPGDDVPMISGMCQAFRRDRFEELGKFATNIGGWGSEDLEICIRAWLHGYRVAAAPGAKLGHRFRESFADDFDLRIPLINDLRTVLMNFSPRRIARVLDVMSNHADFDHIFNAAAIPDTMRRREANLKKAKHTDDYFFERFPGDPIDG